VPLSIRQEERHVLSASFHGPFWGRQELTYDSGIRCRTGIATVLQGKQTESNSFVARPRPKKEKEKDDRLVFPASQRRNPLEETISHRLRCLDSGSCGNIDIRLSSSGWSPLFCFHARRSTAYCVRSCSTDKTQNKKNWTSALPA